MISINNPFFMFLNKVVDVGFLAILWIVFSIPVITLGASTTALYYVLTKQVSDREGYITKDFMRSFKLNFKQSTLIFIVLIVISYISYINIVYINNNFDTGSVKKIILLAPQYTIILEILLITIYIFPIMSRYKLTIKELFITSILVAHKNMGITAILLTTLLLLFIASLYIRIGYIILPPIYMVLSAQLIVYTLRKYNSGLDIEN